MTRPRIARDARHSSLRRGVAAFAFVSATAGLFGTGCTKTYIPNTDVEDNGDNRKVILFCEEYRRAVEEKNIPKLLSMASPAYFEDGGNSTGHDDIDVGGLKEYLTGQFGQTLAIRYEIRYRHVAQQPNTRIYVDYTYAAAYKIPTAKGEEWKHTVADNRLVLVPDGDSFKILSGM
jgi:hypothetical protein